MIRPILWYQGLGHLPRAKSNINPLPNDTFWTVPNLKEFADDNFKCEENDEIFFKRLESSVGKGEIVTSNFSFPHCVFRRLVVQTRKNQGLFGKGLITTTKNL